MDHTSLHLDLDSNFEPQQRARSNTWPLPRPENYVDVKEEAADGGGGGGGGGGGSGGGVTLTMAPPGHDAAGNGLMGAGVMGLVHGGVDGPCGVGGVGVGAPKKNSSRRNAWGNMSYADLITQAIQSCADKRLTLSQIYDWMVHNVPYFKDKGDSNSSAGWKVT